MNETVTITNNVYDAIEWAQEQYGTKFKVHNMFPSPYWQFTFTNPQEANIFALKWL